MGGFAVGDRVIYEGAEYTVLSAGAWYKLEGFPKSVRLSQLSAAPVAKAARAASAPKKSTKAARAPKKIAKAARSTPIAGRRRAAAPRVYRARSVKKVPIVNRVPETKKNSVQIKSMLNTVPHVTTIPSNRDPAKMRTQWEKKKSTGIVSRIINIVRREKKPIF